MKKYLVGILLASMLVVVPFVSSAATIAELQAMIAQLQAQIASLTTRTQPIKPPALPILGTDRVEVITNNDSTKIELVNDNGREKTEVMIKSTYKFKIKNITNSKIYISQFTSPVASVFVNTTRESNGGIFTPGGCSDIYYTTTNVPVVYSPEKQSYLQLEAKQTIDYTYVKYCPVSKMFSGEYVGRVLTIDHVGDIKDVNGTLVRQTNGVAMQTAKSVYVVGETVPWLSGATYTGDKDGLVIKGERLDKVTDVSFNGRWLGKEHFHLINNDMIGAEVGTTVSGDYPVKVKFVEGESNIVRVVIAESTPIAPIEVAPRISAISGNQYPGGWIKLSGMRLTTDVRIVLSGNPGSVTTPSARDTNGDGTRIDFQIPTGLPVGAYYINVYSKTGMKSPTLPFRVSARPVVSASVSQIANILSSLSSILEQLKTQ